MLYIERPGTREPFKIILAAHAMLDRKGFFFFKICDQVERKNIIDRSFHD